MKNVFLENMAIHHFDLLRYLTGRDCKEIYAESFNLLWSWYTGGAVASARLTFEDDLRVSYLASWVSSGMANSWPGEMRIDGERGTMNLHSNGDVTFSVGEKKTSLEPAVMSRQGRGYALQELWHALLTGEKSERDIDDNIKSHVMVHAALASVRLGCPIQLAEMLCGNP